MPSSRGGLGSSSQTNHRLIPSRASDLAHEAQITRRKARNLWSFERSLSRDCGIGMTRVFILRNSMIYSVTLIFPPTPRPFKFRSYIDSAKIGGTVNSPRFDDLI